jgi:ISXO2-like transposase domain
MEMEDYPRTISEFKTLPRVHRVAALLKRWLLGTHQGAISYQHLPYYLDEFTFRFNRRRSRNRGKLLFRLVQQALATEPVPYESITHRTDLPQRVPHHYR